MGWNGPRRSLRVTPQSLGSLCGAAAPGHEGLTASSFFPFFFFFFIKKTTIFDVLKRYSLVKWTMARQTRVLEAVNSQMKQPFTNIWNKKKDGFIYSWSVRNVLLWLAADRLANSNASYQTVLEHLSVQARQTMDKPSSHPAASLDSVKLHELNL